jgi:hypothetical protein
MQTLRWGFAYRELSLGSNTYKGQESRVCRRAAAEEFGNCRALGRVCLSCEPDVAGAPGSWG